MKSMQRASKTQVVFYRLLPRNDARDYLKPENEGRQRPW